MGRVKHRPGLDPAVAEVRLAVRRALADLPDGSTVLVALSGGADSLALAAATAFEAPKLGLRAASLTVDHGLQAESAGCGAAAQDAATRLGLDAAVVRVEVGATGGPEAAARDARYRALRDAAHSASAAAILVGHTLDDQAETVLLGLARGAGAASLQGMAAASELDGIPLLRPLLGVRRATTRAACAAAGLEPWEDPHNADRRFARVRVRETVLPVLESELGPGIAEALARTAAQLREDAEAFDDMIDETIEDIVEHAEAGISVSAAALAANPAALRHRIIRHVVDAEFGAEPHAQPDPRGRAARHRLVRPGPDRSAGMPRPPCRRPHRVHSPHPGRRLSSAPQRREARASRLRGRWSGSPRGRPRLRLDSMRAADVSSDLTQILVTEEQILAKLDEIAAQVAADYAGKNLLLVGVLKGAVMVMADFSRALTILAPMDWMAVSSYGAGTKSSGVVQIRKDLDSDLHDRHVLIVEDIIDSGLTLSWLLENFESRGAASVEVFALLRKPEAAKVEVRCKYVGFDIPNEFVVGYGLDYAERYRNLRDVAVLAPHVYS